MIKAYQHEIKAGLVDALNDNVIALSMFPTAAGKCELSIADILPPTDFKDLFYFEDILVSSGWNGNDDVFGVEELWKARMTPLMKKIDYMHDETDIIGVMCKVKAASFDGEAVQFDAGIESLPKNLDLHAGGYLYKQWKDEKLRARMEDILANIAEWCVSMECTFPSFDYALIGPKGEHLIIARNENTSFLTKHLRIYGGVGEYEGYKVGRYLKDFTFTGKGLVKNPANKRSVITKTEFLGAAASLNIFPKVEKTMEFTKEYVDNLLVQINEAKASIAALTATVENLKGENAKLNTNVASLTEANSAFKAKTEKLENELTTSSASLTKANDEIAKFNLEKTKATRLALFNDIDVPEAKANELVEKFLSASDEMFADLISVMPKKNATIPTLEKVEVEASIASVIVPTDKTKAVRESAQAWLQSNMNSKKGE